jgi:hypothetical protein
MKRAYPILAVAAGLVMAGLAAFAINSRTAEAASSGTPEFARPNYQLAREGAVLDLSRYSSLFDRTRIGEFSTDVQACHDALASAGVRFTQIPAAYASNGCGFDEAVMVQSSLTDWKGQQEKLPMVCDLAARMHMWERHILVPAAEKYLGSPVVEIKAFGSFQCRRVSGADRLSQHSFGKAADIAGFVLADGREISVLADFYSKGAKGDFLREVHDRGCDVFDVTLGPNYNEEHKNHFHFDVGGEHACR